MLKQISSLVISNQEIAHQIYLLRVEAPDIAVSSHPGQFVMIRCGSKLTLNRPFSIHQVNSNKVISFLINKLGFSGIPDKRHTNNEKIAVNHGAGTHWLSQCNQGDTIELLGPLGRGFQVNPDSDKLLLVAGGIGIAPLVYLAQQMSNQKKSITLLLGARTSSALYPQQFLPPQLKTIIATEDGSTGNKGMVTDMLDKLINEYDQVFACGPFQMYRAIFNLMHRNSINRDIQISLETRMGCGFGICYGCSIKTERGIKTVCKDGPVFNIREIIWETVKL